MAIKTHKFDVEATIGTHQDFKNLRLVETVMTGALDDGREVKIVRCALGHPYFEIRIEDLNEVMRIPMKSVLEGLADELGKLHPAPATQDRGGL